MAVTAKLYGKGILAVYNKEIDWVSDTIKVLLTTSSYTPDQDTHDYHNDITNEVSGTGYTAGGATLANASQTYTAGTNKIKLDGDDVTWTTSTITARTAVVYDTTPGSSATNPLICYQQSDGDVSTTAGTFTIAWHADGIVEITVA